MTKLEAIVNHKCPRCRKGDMFKTSMFSWHYADMHEHCPHCGLRYELEPGYFWASMYISYALSVAELVFAGVAAFYIFGESNIWLLISLTISPVIILFTFNFRYSRTLLLHLLSGIEYKKDY
jgi:uncharacterized protein (DUF983 family)